MIRLRQGYGGQGGYGVLFQRELALSWSGGGPLLAVGFFIAMAALLPLAIGPDPAKLAAIAPGTAWLVLSLSSLLSLERMFERDFEDGALDILALGPAPLEAAAAFKGLAQWITVGIPLAIVAPVGLILLGGAARLAPLAFATALVGGLGFSFVGGVAAALALSGRRGGVLIAVIALPLFAPPVIFGAGALDAFAAGLDWRTGLGLLCGYSLAAAALCPFAMAGACKNALS
jgi:heme exporter protein B